MGGGAVKGLAINWHWCVPDQKLFQSSSAGEPVERQAHGGRDRPAQWALKLTFIAAVDVDFACLCLSLAAPTSASRLVWLTFNGLCVCVCVIIIRAHLVVLFVLEMTPFMGCHLWLCCMQSAPLEWERHKNTFYCPGGCAARQVPALAIMPCIYVC